MKILLKWLLILAFWPIALAYYLIKWSMKHSQSTVKSEKLQLSTDVYSDTNESLPKAKQHEIEVKISQHIAKLVKFYKEHGQSLLNQDVDQMKVVKKLIPHADAHTCPYCGVIHPFSATRARKCPECQKKMVVRSGLYIKEQDIEKVEKLQSAVFEQSSYAHKLKDQIQYIQDSKIQKRYIECMLSIAKAYQYCAIIKNITHERGFTFWDFSWRELNVATSLAVETSNSPQDFAWNGYLNISYEQAMHAMRQMKFNEKVQGRHRNAYVAVGMWHNHLIEDLAFNQSQTWRKDEVMRMIHIAIKLGTLTESDIQKINDKSRGFAKTRKVSNEFEIILKEIDSYTLLDDKEQDLLWQIH